MKRSLLLAVQRVFPVEPAELFQFQPVLCRAPVLGRRVVAVLALGASQYA